MKRFSIDHLAVLLVITFIPVAALANNPPAPPVALAGLLILPLMALFTILGGGYAAMANEGKSPTRRRRTLTVIGCVVGIIVLASHEGWGLIIPPLFAFVAIKRAVRMIRCGRKADNSEVGKRISPARLYSMAVVLITVSILLAGTGVAFLGKYPGYGVEGDLKRFVAVQLEAKEKSAQEKQGGSFIMPHINSEAGGDLQYTVSIGSLVFTSLHQNKNRFLPKYTTKFEVPENLGSFQIRAYPTSFPFFPYNYIQPQPSFFADETGAIRTIQVTEAGVLCPSDAPIHHELTGGESRALILDRFGDDWYERATAKMDNSDTSK